MCPDPYDYTGPVPNGSAPQNDCRARSHGILPIGAAAKPWPPLVKAKPGAGKPAATPAPAAESEEAPQVAESEDGVLRRSAEEPAEGGAETMAVEAVIAEIEDAPKGTTDLEAAEKSADAETPEAVEETEAAEKPEAADKTEVAETAEPEPTAVVPEPPIETPPQPEPVAVRREPPPRETPGWRARR